jgi:hypothetical protein
MTPRVRFLDVERATSYTFFPCAAARTARRVFGIESDLNTRRCRKFFQLFVLGLKGFQLILELQEGAIFEQLLQINYLVECLLEFTL